MRVGATGEMAQSQDHPRFDHPVGAFDQAQGGEPTGHENKGGANRPHSDRQSRRLSVASGVRHGRQSQDEVQVRREVAGKVKKGGDQ